jgi:Uma2 family endonuclease
MNVAHPRHWTIKRFLAWAGAQEGRYEFDGIRPVAITGRTARHSRVAANIHAALRSRLRGKPCSFYGPDLGVRIIRDKVRYPDAFVTCTKFPDTAQLAPDVRIIFEVVSPSSGRTDRIEKIRDYAAVPSMRRYVIVETRFAGLLVLHRGDGGDPWTADPLTIEETLGLPDIGLEIPVAAFHEEVDLASVDPTGGETK